MVDLQRKILLWNFGFRATLAKLTLSNQLSLVRKRQSFVKYLFRRKAH
jgi:hypothetical protein